MIRSKMNRLREPLRHLHDKAFAMHGLFASTQLLF
jgi:hypothetical protein